MAPSLAIGVDLSTELRSAVRLVGVIQGISGMEGLSAPGIGVLELNGEM